GEIERHPGDDEVHAFEIASVFPAHERERAGIRRLAPRAVDALPQECLVARLLGRHASRTAFLVRSRHFQAFSTSSSACSRVSTSGGAITIVSPTARITRPFSTMVSRHTMPTLRLFGKR